MLTRQKTMVLAALVMVATLIIVVTGCGRKADLFLPEQNVKAGASTQQQTQTEKETDKEETKKKPESEN